MPRLPQPGQDSNTWGDILNDFLSQAHNADGTLKDTGLLAAKADDNSVVHNAGAETVTGTKTFSAPPIVPTPTNGSHASTKAYVDSVAMAGAADATTMTKGIVQLAGDLSGTAAGPTVPALATKADSSALTAHTSNTSNPHSVTKAQVGLGNADNTSDANKPVSGATQTALNTKAPLVSPTFTGTVTVPDNSFSATKLSFDPATQAELDAHITDTTDAHDASAISFAPAGTVSSTDVQAAIEEVAAEIAGGGYSDEQAQDAIGTILVDTATIDFIYTDATPSITGDVKDGSITAAKVAADVATQAELDAHTGNTANPHAVTKAQVGLSNVDNTSDANKPVSTAQQTAINAKVADIITDGVITIAPSQNAVFDALALKQDSLGYTAENVANKDTDGTFAANSDVNYPSQKATKTYVDTQVAAGTTPDATTGSKGKIQLAGDLAGTAAAPTVPGLAGKVSSVSAANATITVAGTSTAPTVAVGTIAESQVTNLTSDLAGKANAFITTPVKTANYTATPNDYIPVDTTSGSVTITLPTAPADKTRVGVKMVILGSTNTTTITAGGSDVFNKAGGSTSLNLTLVNQSVMLQYAATPAIWYVQSSDTPISGLDARYVGITGAQTISGAKTFSTAPVIATITNTGTLTLPTATDTLVGRATTDTLSNKRITKRVVALTDGGTITPDGDSTDLATVTIAGNRTMAAPTGTPTAGQQLMIRIKQDATGSRTITWNAIYRFSTDVPSPTLSTAANKTDYIGFQYNAVDSTWDCLAVARGY